MIDKSLLALPEPRRVRDRDHVKSVAKQPCLICGRQPADAHHVRFAQHRALGRKVSDEFTVPLCRGHHRELHRCGDEAAWWKKVGIDPTVCARTLWLASSSTSADHMPAGRDVTGLTTRKTLAILSPRMPFAIVLAPEAVEDLRRLKANVRATMRGALETHLRHQPEKTSRSRIKRLRGLRRPQYRLRVGDIRVFYDVSGTTVQVLAIVAKSEAEEWLAQFANLE